ncbi:MAG: hypothetical protein OEV56_05500, partial [Dehalococcoidia bacterium]|nr:hypothetical protein [Dehalococcoidia bacterium]
VVLEGSNLPTQIIVNDNLGCWRKRSNQSIIDVIVLCWLSKLSEAVIANRINNASKCSESNVELVQTMRVTHGIVAAEAGWFNTSGTRNGNKKGIRPIPIRNVSKASHI